MCRSIKTLYNFDPPATNEEIQAAALQFVRKVSGFHEPSNANLKAFNKGVSDVAHITHRLLDSLVTQAHSHNRELEKAKAHTRAVQRFGIKT
jgi:hypothetical protein